MNNKNIKNIAHQSIIFPEILSTKECLTIDNKTLDFRQNNMMVINE